MAGLTLIGSAVFLLAGTCRGSITVGLHQSNLPDYGGQLSGNSNGNVKIVYVPVETPCQQQPIGVYSASNQQYYQQTDQNYANYVEEISQTANVHNSGIANSGVSHQSLTVQHPDAQGYEGHEEGHGDHHHKKNAYYKIQYAVNDHKTGDIKQHSEERKGDAVTGEYSLVEHDGNIRTVKYYADWKSGFHATVHNSKSGHPLG